MTEIFVIALVKIGLLCFALLTAAAYLVLLERKIAAWVQDRHGPNRVGIPLTKIPLFGLGQPLADGVKIITKENYTPSHVDRYLFVLAPISVLAISLAIFATIPFGSVVPGFFGVEKPIQLVVAPSVDVGVIYVFALSSMAVYGVILGGWASNNKYSFLGGLRSSAQMISYEIPLGLGLLGVVLTSGSLRLETIITSQAESGIWNLVWQPLGCLVFVTAAFAESARLPFDLPECEQELIGGYHTEYGGMKLLLYLVGEFLHMVTAAFLIVILFLGGWHLWGVTGHDDQIGWFTAFLRIGVLLTKVMAVIMFMMLVRWSWPRFRFDQLMNLAWKVMLPLGFVNLVFVAFLVEFETPLRERFGAGATALGIAASWGLLVVAAVAAGLLSPLATDNRPRFDARRFDRRGEPSHPQNVG